MTLTTIDLLAYLNAHFPLNGPGRHGRFYDRDNTRVEFDDVDIIVYRFTDDERLLDWKAHFSAGTPVDVIVATIEAP